MAERLTPWFPAEVKPVRDGVYQAIHGGWEIGFARWERGRWLTLRHSVLEASVDPFTHGASQDKVWRGLAKEHPHA